MSWGRVWWVQRCPVHSGNVLEHLPGDAGGRVARKLDRACNESDTSPPWPPA